MRYNARKKNKDIVALNSYNTSQTKMNKRIHQIEKEYERRTQINK